MERREQERRVPVSVHRVVEVPVYTEARRVVCVCVCARARAPRRDRVCVDERGRVWRARRLYQPLYQLY